MSYDLMVFEKTKAPKEKHGVGFFDVSGNGQIIFPDGKELK